MTKNNFERAQALADCMGHRSIIRAILCLRRGAKRKEMRKNVTRGAQNCSPLSFPSLVGSCVHRKEKGSREWDVAGLDHLSLFLTCLWFEVVWRGWEDEGKLHGGNSDHGGMGHLSTLFYFSLIGYGLERMRRWWKSFWWVGERMQITAVWVTCLSFKLICGWKWCGEEEGDEESLMVG